MIKLEKVSKFKKQPSNQQIKNQQQVLFIPSQNSTSSIEQQFTPQFIQKNYIKENLNYQLVERYQQRNYFNRQFENATLTYFIYKKITVIRYIMMSFSIMSIMMSIFIDQFNQMQDQLLILQSVLTIALISMVLIKQFLSEQLKNKQLLRERTQNIYIKFIKSVWIQLLILTAHPSLITKGYIIQVEQPINDSMIGLKINTFLQILMQTRIYLLYLTVINSSIYCNTRAHRLCRIYSTKSHLFFGIKSLFQYKPLTFLIVLYLGLVTTYGQMISLSQRDLQQDFADFQNSVWLIVITMGTVGYGDYSPLTYLGRVICFSAAISGIIISSLLILTLSKYLSMSNGQNKSHVTLKRLQLRRQLQRYSKQTIKFTTNMIFRHYKDINNTKPKQQNLNQNKKIMQQLKRKTQRVKFAIRRIKNIVDTDNLKQQINRLFEALGQSLNQIYQYQQQYSQLLTQLYKKQKDTINQIQFSFTTEIQNIIKDR